VTLLSNSCHQPKIEFGKDTIVKKLGKVINPSGNTNPFNYNTNYLKLYTSVKEGIGNTDEFGQLIYTQYLDDVFNFATSLPALTRKVRVELRGELTLRIIEVQVFNYANVNVALHKTATQSPDKDGDGALKASNAVDDHLSTFSHTTTKPGKYIPQVLCIILIFYSLLFSVSI
jgi:hypothetical protein